MSQEQTLDEEEQRRGRALRESFAYVAQTASEFIPLDEIEANVQQPQETMHQWAYNSGDVERVQTYETARNSATWLSEHWGTENLRKEPTLPCRLWERNTEGSRQAIRPATVLMVTPDSPGFQTTRQQAETLMSAHRERDIEIREAQVNNEPTIPFHFTHSMQDATTYYLNGADIAATSFPNYTAFSIPTPPQQYGIFHERIAFSATSTTSYPSQTWNVTIQDAYYMQSGSWSGPYTVTVPGQVMWTVASNSTATNIFSPPQDSNVFGRGITANPRCQPGCNQPVFNQGWNVWPPNAEDSYGMRRNGEQKLGDSPECDFERIVQRHEIELAYVNSKKLLKTWLRPEEYYSLIKFGYMIVPSKLYPRVDYWIHDDDHAYVDAYDECSNALPHVAETYCLHSVESRFQKYDKILAKILLLKADEAEFLRRAIKHGGDNVNLESNRLARASRR